MWIQGFGGGGALGGGGGGGGGGGRHTFYVDSQCSQLSLEYSDQAAGFASGMFGNLKLACL